MKPMWFGKPKNAGRWDARHRDPLYQQTPVGDSQEAKQLDGRVDPQRETRTVDSRCDQRSPTTGGDE
jgi:hypothetical protein